MLSILFFIGLVVVGCEGQTHEIFQWQFKDQVLPNDLGTCVSYPIVVKPFNETGNFGVPPYYMISFPVGGIPKTTPIGSEPENLSWMVTHPAGSKLLLSVVDSTGGAGGVPTQLFAVIEGMTTECVSTPGEPTPFTVKANVTNTLETCQPWGITVTGGTPPYNITLAQTGSPVVTNVSMPFGNNRFTFPNRALPGGSLIAAITDFEGRWASGTPVVTPTGECISHPRSTDVACIGRVASSGDAATIDAQDAVLDTQLAASKRRKSIIIGVAVTLVLLLFIGCGVLGYLRYRKRAQIKRKRLSEQRARQNISTDIPSRVNGSTQIWETFGASIEAQTSNTPIYQKRSRMPPEMPPVVMSEPDVQAPPYQEFDINIPSIRHETTRETALDRVERPQRSLSPRNAAPKRSSQSLRQHIPRLLTAATRSEHYVPKATRPRTGGGFASSRQVAGSSLGLATKSGMASAYPEALASISAVTPSIPDMPGRKTSAQFVAFPKKSVRAPRGNGSSAADRQLREHSAHTVEAIVEEDIMPPTYRSRAQ